MIQESLYRIGIDYFDKYLIHWPLPKQDKYEEAWQAFSRCTETRTDQNDVLLVVKSSSYDHQKANLDVFDFELTEADIRHIDSLDKGEPGRVEGQHPNEYEEFD